MFDSVLSRRAGLSQDCGPVAAHGRARLQPCSHQPRCAPAEILALARVNYLICLGPLVS